MIYPCTVALKRKRTESDLCHQEEKGILNNGSKHGYNPTVKRNRAANDLTISTVPVNVGPSLAIESPSLALAAPSPATAAQSAASPVLAAAPPAAEVPCKAAASPAIEAPSIAAVPPKVRVRIREGKAKKKEKRVRFPTAVPPVKESSSIAEATPCVDAFQMLHSILLQDQPNTKYDPVSQLGSGAFGQVWKGKNSHNETVAMKKISWPSDSTISCTLAEMFHLRACSSHQNIPTYKGCFSPNRKEIWIVMEYIEGVTISALATESRLHESAIAGICSQVANALDYLQSSKLVHCDVKPDNIMVKNSGHVYLCDLGLSTVEGSILCTAKGTLSYMAPEVLLSETYSGKADVWSLGMSVVHMWTCNAPYHGLDYETIQQCLLNYYLPGFEEIMPDMMWNFLLRCLEFDSVNRASASELLDHGFLSPVNSCNRDQVCRFIRYPPAVAPSLAAVAPAEVTPSIPIVAASLTESHVIAPSHPVSTRGSPATAESLPDTGASSPL